MEVIILTILKKLIKYTKSRLGFMLSLLLNFYRVVFLNTATVLEGR